MMTATVFWSMCFRSCKKIYAVSITATDKKFEAELMMDALWLIASAPIKHTDRKAPLNPMPRMARVV